MAIDAPPGVGMGQPVCDENQDKSPQCAIPMISSDINMTTEKSN